MKSIKDPIVYIVVRTWPGGRRDNLKIFLNEDTAKFNASQWIGKDYHIHLETCVINGTFVEENGRLVE